MPLKPIGTPGGIHSPVAKINGVDIQGFSVDFSIGQISTANISLPPESLGGFFEGDADEEIVLEVDGRPLFTGFNSGPSGVISEYSLDFGLDLIHKARILDEGRCFSPGLHPMSTDDYTFIMSSGGDDTAAGPFDDIRLLGFDVTANLGTEIPGFLIKVMGEIDAAPASLGLPRIDQLMGNIRENNQRVVSELEKIVSMGECKLSLGNGGIRPMLEVAAKAFAQKIVTNSVSSGKSAWDLLSSFFSQFGLTMLCSGDGTVRVMPDFSGCKPPSENELGADVISLFQAKAKYSRNPGGVIVLGHGLDRGTSGFGSTSRAIGPRTAMLGGYSPKGAGSRGALVSVGLPAWMAPSQQSEEIPELPDRLIQDYARQIYSEVLNMNRSIIIQTPFMPDAVPGTTYTMDPAATIRMFSGGSLPFEGKYHGYCYKVVHAMQSNSKNVTSTLYFKNVFSDAEADNMLDGAPFLSGQEPFSVEGGL